MTPEEEGVLSRILKAKTGALELDLTGCEKLSQKPPKYSANLPLPISGTDCFGAA